MSDPATDHYQDKRIAKLEQQVESLMARVEDLERASSPDGIADASAPVVDERQQHVAQFCQMMRQKYGESQTDLIGGA